MTVAMHHKEMLLANLEEVFPILSVGLNIKRDGVRRMFFNRVGPKLQEQFDRTYTQEELTALWEDIGDVIFEDYERRRAEKREMFDRQVEDMREKNKKLKHAALSFCRQYDAYRAGNFKDTDPYERIFREYWYTMKIKELAELAGADVYEVIEAIAAVKNPSPYSPGIYCQHIGVAGTTGAFLNQNDDGTWTARAGIAIMGSTQMDEKDMEACFYDPFHPDWRDNYAEGTGDTPLEALNAMTASTQSLSDML